MEFVSHWNLCQFHYIWKQGVPMVISVFILKLYTAEMDLGILTLNIDEGRKEMFYLMIHWTYLQLYGIKL